MKRFRIALLLGLLASIVLLTSTVSLVVAEEEDEGVSDGSRQWILFRRDEESNPTWSCYAASELWYIPYACPWVYWVKAHVISTSEYYLDYIYLYGEFWVDQEFIDSYEWWDTGTKGFNWGSKVYKMYDGMGGDAGWNAYGDHSFVQDEWTWQPTTHAYRAFNGCG